MEMSKTKIKLKPEIKARWLAALRSGHYQQGYGRLRTRYTDDRPDEFCCLGVLTDLAVGEGVGAWGESVASLAEGQVLKVPFMPGRFANGEDLYGETGMLDDDVIRWAFDVPPDVRHTDVLALRNPHIDHGTWGQSLGALNDTGADFEQIAGHIEQAL